MAVRIDAVGDYLERTNVAVPFTVYGWLQLVTDRNDYSTVYAIDQLAVGSSSGYAFSLETDADGTTLGLYNGSTFVGSRSLSAGTWYFFAISVASDGIDATWYHAGLTDASLYSQAVTLAASCNNYRHHVGNNAYGEWANCRVAGLRIADSVLTSAELENARQRQVADRALYLWSPLLVDATDYSGNGRNWTAGGTVTYEDGPPVSWGARPWVVPFVAAGGGTTYNQSAAGALTPAGATIKRANKPLAGTLTSAGAAVRRTRKVLIGVVTSAGVLAKRTGKIAAGTLTSTGAAVRRTAKNFAGALTSSGALARSLVYVVSLAGTLTSAGALTRRTTKGLAGTLTSSGALIRRVAKSLAGTLTSVGALVADFVSGSATYSQSVGGTLAAAGDLARQTNKATAGALTMAGAITRRIIKSFAGTLTAAGALVRSWTSPTAAKLDVTLADARANTVALADARANTVTLVDGPVNTVTLGDATR